MQSWPLAGEEPLCVHGGLKKGTEKSPMLPVPSAAGARLAFMQQCQRVEVQLWALVGLSSASCPTLLPSQWDCH